MSLSLAKVFAKKQKPDTAEEPTFVVINPKTIPITYASEAYYQFLFPQKTTQALTIPQKLVIDVARNSLQKKDTRNKAVPRLPQVIPKLLRSLRDPKSSAKDYVDIINKDPVMSAAVLKLANSVYFNPIGARIDEIERAVVKLGIDGLRSVLSAAVMHPIIQKDSAYFSKSGQRMWQHSLCCAVACEIIANHLNVEKFKVYVLGLIHDIGKITLFSELSRQFKLNGEDVNPGYNAFAPPMKLMSNAISYWVAKDWEMPKDICKALAEQVKLAPGQEISTFGHILYQANLVAESYACIRPKNPARALKLLKELKLPEDMYESMDELSREY